MGYGITPLVALAAPSQRRSGGAPAGALPREAAAEGPSSRRVPDRGGQRGRPLPWGRPSLLVLVVLAGHPDPLVPALVDPAGGSDDRGLRRRTPRGLADQGGDRRPHARIRDLHRERHVRTQLRVPSSRCGRFFARGDQRCGREHPAFPAPLQGVHDLVPLGLRQRLDDDLRDGTNGYLMVVIFSYIGGLIAEQTRRELVYKGGSGSSFGVNLVQPLLAARPYVDEEEQAYEEDEEVHRSHRPSRARGHGRPVLAANGSHHRRRGRGDHFESYRKLYADSGDEEDRHSVR